MDMWLRQIHLQTLELAAIADHMTAIIQTNARESPGAKTIIGVTGPNLIGKSTLAMRWARALYNNWIRGAELDRHGRPIIRLNQYCEVDLIPLIWIDLRDQSRNSTVDRKVLNYCGLPPGGNNDAISIAANNAAKRHQTRVVILDDVHFLWLNWKGGPQVLDHIKHLNTELGQIGATLVLVGANLKDTELVHDPQICGRLKLHTLDPYDVDANEAQQETWQRAVKQIEDIVLPYLPAGEEGMLYTELVGELWYRSGGYLGYMTKLVIEATLAATCDRSHRITLEHLEAIELSHGAETARQERLKKSRNDRTAP
ncbi:TniB family NTP-binding protein [Mycobacteroides abscessus]|nr:TniB family NTP-binding protein [Mycobacteroides abscessus]